MPELLLELLSEDIPARMQARAAEELKRLVTAGLEKQGLTFERAIAYATPRRLSLVVDGLPKRQPATREKRRGPSVDAPDAAVEGFAKSVGLAREALKTEAFEKGEYYVADVKHGGRAVRGVIAEIVRDAVWALAWPKSMTWSEAPHLPWVRPLQSILCILDGRMVKFDLARGMASAETGKDPVGQSPHGLASGNWTVGHRFLAPKRIKASSFADYEAKLRGAKVILAAAERRGLIEGELKRLAEAAALSVKEDAALLDEVAGLVEWPVVLLGQIDERFMGLPDEVLATVMRRHQKYFSLLCADGTLAPRFAVVANIDAADGGAKIVAGNERVLAARLADAQFFWDQDRKRTLESREHLLQGIMFHNRLGTLAHKVTQTQHLAGDICNVIKQANQETVHRAAQLAKLDLVTEMVKEFPELQGVIGKYYAMAQKETEVVADAIATHYRPVGPHDSCPSEPNAVAVALADKIDTLAGFWVIDETPTGSRDPFGLRRAALGAIRLILENEIHINLRSIIETAVDPYMIHRINNEPDFAESLSPKRPTEDERFAEKINPNRKMELTDDQRYLASTNAIESLLNFFRDRLTVFLKDRGFRYDLVNALLDSGSDDDLLQLVQKAEALSIFLETDDGSNLLIAYRRASNIVEIEERKDDKIYGGSPSENKFKQPEEIALWTKLSWIEQQNHSHVDMAQFDILLHAIANLREPIDRFFDEVTVNTDDPEVRENRLLLLSEINRCMDRVAHFSQIEG